jgi:DNA repair ATPase RecN
MSSEIEELSSRIMAAMERIANGLDALGGADSEDAEALRQALEDEQQANAQLSERVRVLADRQEEALRAMEEKANAAQQRVSALDIELQKLRKANQKLNEICTALRDANAEGVGEPHLINKSMMAELESIRAMRSAEMAEADEIIAALTPLVNAAGQTGETKEAH